MFEEVPTMLIAALSPARTLAAAALAGAALATVPALPASAQGNAAASDRTTETGTLVQVVSDDFERGKAGYAYGLQKQDRSFVSVDGISPSDAKGLVGRTVRVTGKAVGKDRVAADGVVAAADAGSTTDPSGTTVAAAGAAESYRKVAVVLVNFADSPTQPVTPDQVRGTMFSNPQNVDAYYQDASDGKLGVTGDVFGWFTVSRTVTSTCDYSAWGNAAKTAATNAGIDLSTYQSVMYYWPTQSACSWAGLGQLPGSTIWINGYNSLRVLGHELGHNLGEHHASSEQCTLNGAYVAFPGSGATCSVVEYGDPFTIMGGSSYYLHSNAARSHYGYITPVTTTAGVGGSYDLVPADSTAGGTRMVRIPRGDGSYLSLEFRRPTGSFDTFAATAPVANGVTIRIDWGTGTKQTMLVDTVPSTSSYTDAPLIAGQSITDPVSGATITTSATSDTGASVTVSYGGSTGGTGTTTTPPADTTAPTSVTNLTAAASSTPSVSLSWGAATDNVGVTGYRVSRNGTVLSTATGTSFVDSTIAAGSSYTYSVAAVDAAGNVGPATSVTATVPSPAPTTDTTAPTAVTGLKAVANKKGVVSVSWNAATDNVGVKSYTITRTGLTKTQTTTSLSDKPGRGTFTYTVVATDAAGNSSTPVSVTVTV